MEISSLKFAVHLLSVTITEQIALRLVASVAILQLVSNEISKPKLLGTVVDDRPSWIPHLIDLKKRFASWKFLP